MTDNGSCCPTCGSANRDVIFPLCFDEPNSWHYEPLWYTAFKWGLFGGVIRNL